jgi:hypothetical protein
VPPLDLGLGLRRGAQRGGNGQGSSLQFQLHVFSVSAWVKGAALCRRLMTAPFLSCRLLSAQPD